MRKIILLGCLVVFAFSNIQAVTKLNQTFAAFGLANNVQFAPSNNQRVVYRADVGALGIFELFSVNYTQGPNSVTNLSLPLALGGSIFDFQISPDGNRVVFRGDKDVDTTNELYSVAIEGGTVVKLNSPLVANGDVLNDYQISSDSARVIYRANQDSAGMIELYSALIAATGSTKLNDMLVVGGNIIAFQISPDGTRVVYRADQDMDQVIELYSAQIAATGSTKLNDILIGGGNVLSFQISSNSARVVYLANQDTVTVNELYSAQIAATGSTKLNDPLAAMGNVQFGFQISPDSARVVYRADQDANGTNELYSAQIAATGSTKLNDTLPMNGDVDEFQISPDSARVVYLADQDINNVIELYSSQIAATGSTKLNDPLVAGQNVLSYQISPDSSRVVYQADQDTDGINELYSVPIAAAGSTKLNGPLVMGQNVISGFQISPDNTQVIYRADQDIDGVSELYRVPIAGGGTTKLNTPLVMNENVISFEIHPFGNPLIYRADQDLDETFELYVTAILPPVITSPLAAATTVGANNFSYTITATNEPITGYGASGLPSWANLNSNVITGIPDAVGFFAITLSATNDAGIDTKILNLTVNQSNVVIVTPSATGFTGDFDGDGTLDLVTQKKKTATLIAFTSNGVNTSQAIALNKKDKIVGANVINSNNALIVQNRTTINAVVLGNNFTAISNITLGSVASPKTKVVASGDINGDGLVDIVTQQGKTIGALLSPSYTAATLVNTKKANPKVVGVIARIGAESNAVSSLVLAKGKKLFFYDIPTNSPFIPGEGNEPQAGPIFDKKYKVRGAVAGTNTGTAKLIISKGKNVGIVNYGVTTLGTPAFKTIKKLGKVVAPQ
jgi:dipeptidyl aminopeptidase/acylaminoacyl peptidase